jgi:hypothetical protein
MAEEFVSYDKYRADLADFRSDMARFREEVRSDLASMRVEMHQQITSQTKWLAGAILTAAGLTVALIKLLP